MKNINNEKATLDVHGRALYSTKFVNEEDLIGKNILEIGCGFGGFELFAVTKNINSITGIEKTEKDLETAKKNISHPKIKFTIGSAIKLPFEDNSFDTVVSWDVIEHIPKKKEDKMFKEVFRVLKKGGSFYLSTAYRSFFGTITDMAWWLIEHRHYSEKILHQYGITNNFNIIKTDIRGGWGYILWMWNFNISKWIFRRKPFFLQYFYKVQDREFFTDKKGLTSILIQYKK